MDITRQHPLVKLTAQQHVGRLAIDDDPPLFKCRLRRSQVDVLERLLRWLDQVRREKRVSDELLVAHKRELDRLCQDLYERGGA